MLKLLKYILNPVKKVKFLRFFLDFFFSFEVLIFNFKGFFIPYVVNYIFNLNYVYMKISGKIITNIQGCHKNVYMNPYICT